MSTINGKRSVFVSVPHPEASTEPSPPTVDYETHVQHQIDDAIKFARQLQRWTESSPTVACESPDFIGLSDKAEERAWLEDEAAQSEYQAWVESCRESEPLPTPTDAEKRAEMHELSRLGDAALYCINGSDMKWQQGGS